ncbi:MAG: hypothetical protein ACRD9W_05285 [Terriglobia bacterium]
MNHAPGGIINPPRPFVTDANTLISLPLSGAQPTWRDIPVAASRSKMTRLEHRRCGAKICFAIGAGKLASDLDTVVVDRLKSA